MTPQQLAMLQDIRSCRNLMQLRALEQLELEFPQVFVPAVRTAITERYRHLNTPKADKLSPVNRVPQLPKSRSKQRGQLHLPCFLSRVCGCCRRKRRLVRG